jgi:copper(I)-binding protein
VTATAAAASSADAGAAARPRQGGPGRARLAELGRAVAGPVACAAVLTGLLSAWVAAGGAGTLTTVQIQVTQAAVPMRAFTAQAADAVHSAGVYLTIRNLARTPDELIAVRSPLSGHVVLTERAGPGARPAVVNGLAIPARGTLALSPLAADVTLENPVPFEDRQSVPLTLVFRRAGQVTIDAPVTAPGTP